MKEKVYFFLIPILLICLAFQIWFLLSLRFEKGNLPLLLPYTSQDMEMARESGQHHRESPGSNGPIMTTDDLIRGILVIEEDKNLKLSSSQKEQILPLVKEAAQAKEKLHQLRKRKQILQAESCEKAIRIFSELTEQQRSYIRANRDEVEKRFQEISQIKKDLGGNAGGKTTDN